MVYIAEQFKQILVTAIFLLIAAIAWPQAKPQTHSKQLSNFNKLTAEAGMLFTFPEEFKEIPVVNTERFPFDYAISLPDKEFEIWFMVRAPKNYPKVPSEAFNPDSTYNHMAETEAKAFTGDHISSRGIPKDILARYNADEGKTYLLDLQDLLETKHYKYALLVTLEKDHTGTVLVVCLGNDKGTGFFQNINKAVTCLKFK
ncbi:MAG TPA: hypothetical protein VHS53_13000 [Mucilaginibacter sp.]|jgi:hypothetical protein|nr:hypothetical protein [Mucilaginibacter sp.]